MSRALSLLAAVAGWLVLSAGLLPAQNADLIFFNGKVPAVDNGFTVAQAVAVMGNMISAVGTDQAVLATAGPNTQKVDLKGHA